MGSAGSEMLGKFSGGMMNPQGGSVPPIMQVSQARPQPQPQQGQSSGMEGLIGMFMNQMMGGRSGGGGSGLSFMRPQQQSVSPRDALIQSLMGGGYGR